MAGTNHRTTENAQRSRRTRLTAEARRTQILEVATKLIAERGFWATSMREVAIACGITLNGVLYHFAAKEDLLIEVLRHRDRLDTAAMEERFSGRTEETPVTLGELCEAIVERNSGQREIVRLYSVLSAESLAPDHPAHEYFAARQQHALEGLASLAPVVSDRAAAAREALALMDGLQLQWLRDPSRNWVQDWRDVVARRPDLSP